MEKYHKYVFDSKNRKFRGKFEKMYRGESREGFDSWHQEDSRRFIGRIILSFLQDYNFDFIIDIGCGKGSITHILKKKNNKVFGIDISKTALDIARQKYPDVEFAKADINNIAKLKSFLKKANTKKADLILAIEILSYIRNWKEVLEVIANNAQYILVSLFIPENPIGFVKSEKELVSEIEKHFEIIEWANIKNRNSTIILGRSKKCRDSN
jgi:trans-aconitate methyltransferase